MAIAECSSVTVLRRGLNPSGRGETGSTLVWLQAEHDLSTATALSETLARAVALDDSDLVVDVSRVEFMEAPPVGVIISFRRILRTRSRLVVLRCPALFAQRLLDVCGVADLLSTSLPKPA